MTRSVWQPETFPSPTGLPTETDIAIVGAGIVGAATAWALAEAAPGLRIVVLDATGPAAGASGRNAGFLLLGTHTDYASAVDALGREAARALWHLTRENLHLAIRLGETVDVGLRLPGSVLAAGSVLEAERLHRSQALLTEDGISAEWLSGEAAASRVGATGFEAALWVRDGGSVDPVRLVGTALAASGATVVSGARVRGIEPDGAGIAVHLSGGVTVRSGHVALCLNAYLPQVVPALAPFVRPVRAQMLATAPVAPVLAAPVYSHDGYYYAQQRPDGRVLVGGARHLHRDGEVGYADAVTDALQADLEAYLRTHLPAAAGAPVERRWSGTMGFSPDALPTVGAVPDVPGAVFAAGFTGHGMGFGLRVGQIVARRLLGEADPADALFRPDRFASDPMRTESGARDGT